MDCEVLLADVLCLISAGYGFFNARVVDSDTDEEIGYGRPRDFRDIGFSYLVTSIEPDEVSGSIRINVIETY